MTTESTEALARKELLKTAYRKIEELRSRLAANAARKGEPVAIVGLACRFPGGVTDCDSFWELLSSGRDGITEIPSDRWNIDEFYDPDPDAPNKMYVRRGGFIENVRGFDPLFFHVSPLEASSMDPQQRILLEVTWEALENAGLAPDRLSGSQTSVFIGTSGSEYSMMAAASQPDETDATHAATGGNNSIAAGRISYFLGLRGPSVAVDTACSSALTAIHLATQSLRSGELTMALAGSVNLILSPYGTVVVSKARMLSPEGACKTFDAAANGYVRSEGCAVLVLKLLSQAEADGDRILALIKGSASNQDGRTNGITAPNGNAQREVIQAALGASELSADDVDYVETHGTGTSLGDPIEVQALGEVFAPNRPADRKLVLGAVKSNIGHLEAAAGMAAVAKVTLALQREQIPANLHFNTPNPHIPWSSLPFAIPTGLTPWNSIGKRKVAGVSAFGFSGTNVHMVIEQAPEQVRDANTWERPCHLLTLSAQVPQALSELVVRYVRFLGANSSINLADVCFTANTGRAHFAYRMAAVASTVDELKAQLQLFTKQPSAAGSVHSDRAPSQPPQLGLIFATESLAEIHRQLFHQSPVFKAAIEACNAAAIGLFGDGLPVAIWDQAAPAAAIRAPSTQANEVLAFALSYAISVQWREWGLKPTVVSGFGIGRYVAAVFAGALSLRDGLRLAVDPAADQEFIDWSTPQMTFLSAMTGSPMTRESLKDSAESRQPAKLSPGLAALLSEYQREGPRIVLAIGVTPVETSPLEMQAAGVALTYLAVPNGDWYSLLDTVGALYAAGIAINWQKLESLWRRQRLVLPTYPFQREECWFKSKPAVSPRQSLQSDLHPLLGRRVYSPQFRSEIVFEAVFDTVRIPLLRDHRYFSTIAVSMTTMLEMIAAAGRIVLKQQEVLLEDFLIEQPLLLQDGQTSLVQTILTPEEAGEYACVIMSAVVGRPEDEPNWNRHCRGKLAIAPRSNARANPDLLNALRKRYSEPVDPDFFYGIMTELEVEYGPSFRSMRTIGRDASGTLALLRLPDLTAQPTAFGVHPGLLDSALQAMGLSHRFNLEQLGGRDIYSPVAAEFYHLSKLGLNEMWCEATIRPGQADDSEALVCDFQLYATDGATVGELRGVHFKRAVKRQFTQEVNERRLMNWLFSTRWEALPTLPPALDARGTWLIQAADGNRIFSEFANVVRQRGGRVITVRPGDSFVQELEDHYTMRFNSTADYDRLFQVAIDPTETLRGVICFVAGMQIVNGTGQTIPMLARSATEYVLQLTQALARNEVGGGIELALVTEGFQAPSLGLSSGLASSAVWGFGRVIAAELPDLCCKLIDLELSLPAANAAEMVADEIGSGSEENQVALCKRGRLGLRLAHADVSVLRRENTLAGDARGELQLEIGSRGDFRQLRFVPQQAQPPGLGEVQLRVLATAVNFRDVLNVLGMYPGDPGPLGVECVGEITALGPGVTGWSVGEQVLALPRRGYCTYTNAPVNMVFRRPPNLTLQETATLLVAYLTAAYSLCHLGKMKAGDRVLIHAATGGVGLAAVQLAQQAGAEIFATAGSPAKREYLERLGVPHVMDSRTINFAAQTRALTADQGVDLVLNSLTGQAIAEGLLLLRKGGRFLEIGKNELLSTEGAAHINRDAHYHIIDLLGPFQDTPELMQELFADIAKSLSTGALRPLPHRTFDLSDAALALQYMSTAKHIGKVVVIDRSIAPATTVDPFGTYLITGGLGGLGLSVAQWMVEQGASRIVLVGRSAPKPAAEKVISELQALGAQIAVAQADVADRRQVSALLETHTSVSAPLRGVIHAAGLIDDGALVSQDWSRIDRVLAPKIDGAWNLHELTLQTPLDFFVLFSSAAGLFGNAGQSSYAAANVFLDQLAAARYSAGLPSLSINWGAWAEVGMAAAMNERHTEAWSALGLSLIERAQGLTILRMLTGHSQAAQIAVLPIEDSAWQRRPSYRTTIAPFIKNLVGGANSATAVASASRESSAMRLQNILPEEKRDVMIELIGGMVLDIFRLDSSRTVAPDQHLAELGMDSLLAIQLSHRLKSGLGMAVPATLAFQYPTIEDMADYLLGTMVAAGEDTKLSPDLLATEEEVQTLFDVSSGGTQIPTGSAKTEILTAAAELSKRVSPQKAESVLANLGQLSDREVEKLLQAMESQDSAGDDV